MKKYKVFIAGDLTGEGFSLDVWADTPEDARDAVGIALREQVDPPESGYPVGVMESWPPDAEDGEESEPDDPS